MKFKIKRTYLNAERTMELVFMQFNECYIFPMFMLNFHHKKLQEAKIGWLFWSAEFERDNYPANSGPN